MDYGFDKGCFIGSQIFPQIGIFRGFSLSSRQLYGDRRGRGVMAWGGTPCLRLNKPKNTDTRSAAKTYLYIMFI
jgi:hypothetical protein